MAIATLTVDLVAKLGNFERDLGRVAHVAEQNAKRIGDSFKTAQSAIALLGAGWSVSAFTASIRNVIDGADQLNKASQKYGVAVEQLSALGYAGKLADVSLEAIGNGLKKLSVNMADTAAGTGEARDAFKALGLSVTEAGGGLKSSEQVLGEIADKFAGMEDGAGKTALAVKLFGRAGADLIPLLNQGSRGLREMKEEAEQLGAIVGGDLARKSEQFNDNLARLGTAADAFGLALAGGVIDRLVALTDAMVAAVKASDGLISAFRLLDGAQAANPVAALDEVTTRLERLKTLKAEIEGSVANRSPFRDLPFIGTAGDLANLNQQISFAERQRQALSDLARKRGADEFGPPVWVTKDRAPSPANQDALNAAKQEQSTYDSLRKSLTEKLAVQQLDLATTEKLSAAEREYAGFLAASREGLSKLTPAHQEQLRAKYEEYVANDRLLRIEEESRKREEDGLAASIKSVEALEKEVAELKKRGEEIGLNSRQMADLEQRRIDAAIAIREEEIASRMLTDADEVRIAVVRAEIELLKEKKAVLSGNRVADEAATAAKKAEDEWKRTSENIERSLTDALMRGFENGKDAGRNLRDTLYNMFRTLVLQPLIKPLVEPLAEASSLFGKQIADMLRGGGSSGFYPYGGSALDIGNYSANGNVFDAAGVVPFANGGVVSRPTLFPFASGVGLMGEAGPEAIMPLERGADGKLGIKAVGGGVTVQIIEAPGRGGEVSQNRDASGTTFLKVFVEQIKGVIAGDITSGGVVADALQGTYGLNRAAGAWR